MAAIRLLLFCLVLFLNGMLFQISVQGKISQLCHISGNETLSHRRELELIKIEDSFNKAKSAAESKISKLKQHGVNKAEEFEKEYSTFIKDFDVFVYMMQSNPALCDRLIIELRESIDYFVSKILP